MRRANLLAAPFHGCGRLRPYVAHARSGRAGAEDDSNRAIERDHHARQADLPGCGHGGQGTLSGWRGECCQRVATASVRLLDDRTRDAKSPAVRGLSMRRRGLEPPPGKPGPGPQPGNPSVRYVRPAPERPMRPGTRTIRTHRTGRMLPRCCHEPAPRSVRGVGRAVRTLGAGATGAVTGSDRRVTRPLAGC